MHENLSTVNVMSVMPVFKRGVERDTGLIRPQFPLKTKTCFEVRKAFEEIKLTTMTPVLSFVNLNYFLPTAVNYLYCR